MSNKKTCPNCGKEVKQPSNFCDYCGVKVVEICNCWVEKKPYNCGYDKCPGIKDEHQEQEGQQDLQTCEECKKPVPITAKYCMYCRNKLC